MQVFVIITYDTVLPPPGIILDTLSFFSPFSERDIQSSTTYSLYPFFPSAIPQFNNRSLVFSWNAFHSAALHRIILRAYST